MPVLDMPPDMPTLYAPVIMAQASQSMFAMDVPDLPPQYAPVMIAQASQARQSTEKTDRTIGVCGLVQNPMAEPVINQVAPIAAAVAYFGDFEGRQLPPADAVTTMLRIPQHGTLKPNADAPGGYLYNAKQGYFGPDRATFLVEISGKKIRVEFFFKVLEGVADNDYLDKQFCPRGRLWKISLSPDNSSAREFVLQNSTRLMSVSANAPKS
jgi:hypothetical protein